MCQKTSRCGVDIFRTVLGRIFLKYSIINVLMLSFLIKITFVQICWINLEHFTYQNTESIPLLLFSNLSCLYDSFFYFSTFKIVYCILVFFIQYFAYCIKIIIPQFCYFKLNTIISMKIIPSYFEKANPEMSINDA